MYTIMCTRYAHSFVYMCYAQFHVCMFCTLFCVYMLCTQFRANVLSTVPCVKIMYTVTCTCTQFHGLQVSASVAKLRVQQIGIFKERRLGTPCRVTLAPYAAVGEKRNNCDIRVETKLRWMRDVRPVHQRRVPCHDQQLLVDASCN